MPGPVLLADGSQLRPLSARSAVLSTLLGSVSASLRPAELVALGAELGFGENALRASLSRMVGAGELNRGDDGYRLNERLAHRQRRQEAAVHASSGTQAQEWDGTWLVAVVTVTGRDANERAALRAGLRGERLAELREGVWVRPSNLPCDLARFPEVSVLRGARPEAEDTELAARLWDLPAWSARARLLLDAADTCARGDDRAALFIVMAGIVRHLLDDPVLPQPLLPSGYPADRLRAAYAGYRADLLRLRQELLT